MLSVTEQQTESMLRKDSFSDTAFKKTVSIETIIKYSLRESLIDKSVCEYVEYVCVCVFVCMSMWVLGHRKRECIIHGEIHEMGWALKKISLDSTIGIRKPCFFWVLNSDSLFKTSSSLTASVCVNVYVCINGFSVVFRDSQSFILSLSFFS